MKKIVFVATRFPYPAIGGDRLRALHFCEHLARTHEVHLVCTDAEKLFTQEAIGALMEKGIILHAFPRKRFAALSALLVGIFAKKPFEISYFSPAWFGKKVREIVADVKPDVVLALYIRGGYAARGVDAPVVLIADDNRTFYQSESFKQASFVGRLIRRHEIACLPKIERELYETAKVTSFVTEEDYRAAQKIAPKLDWHILTCGVDLEQFAYGEGERQDIVFAGKLNLASNVRMIERMVHEILPIVRKEFPHVRLIVAGANPPGFLHSQRKRGVVTTGRVKSLAPYLQEAAVFLHPHVGCSGMQTKVLEAMSSGAPVVTTPTGISGIPVTDDTHVLIGVTNKELAAAVIETLRNPEKAKERARCARKLMETDFAWPHVDAKLDELINCAQ